MTVRPYGHDSPVSPELAAAGRLPQRVNRLQILLRDELHLCKHITSECRLTTELPEWQLSCARNLGKVRLDLLGRHLVWRQGLACALDSKLVAEYRLHAGN